MIIDKEMEIRDHAKWIKVHPPCDSNYGNWFCIDCACGFRNNIGMFAHDRDYPKHHIVWHCADHGFEAVPKPED